MKEFVKIFKALGDENRLKILNIIGSQEVCACKLLEFLDIGQPTLSHHMKILCDCGLVNSRKEGKWSFYSLNNELFSEITKYLNSIKNNLISKICPSTAVN